MNTKIIIFLVALFITVPAKLTNEDPKLKCNDTTTVNVYIPGGHNDPDGDGDLDGRGYKFIDGQGGTINTLTKAKNEFKKQVKEGIKNGTANYLKSDDGTPLTCPGCPDPNETGCDEATVTYLSGNLEGFANDNRTGYYIKPKTKLKLKIACNACIPITGTGTVQSVFPNPASNILTIEAEIFDQPVPVTVKLLDMLGNEVSVTDFGMQPPGIHYLDVSVVSLISGHYFAVVDFGGETGATVQVIVN